jgi:superfamily II DNA or RNA helicase
VPTLRFESGTVTLGGAGAAESDPALASIDLEALRLAWDGRTAAYRAPAIAYAPIVLAFRRAGIPLEDEARRYDELPSGARVHREPRPYQTEALAAWRSKGGRGVVVLPTGAGKTQVATMAIDDRRRSTLVVAPTLDLVRQWYDVLRATFGVAIGVLGGGDHRIEPITVTTYDSAYLHVEHLGARFGLLVFDECHHLPSPTYALAARLSLAPFRLGLTATPERTDGLDAALTGLVGPTVYRRDIGELAGEYLAEYDTERVEVELTPEEREDHDAERAIYRAFLGKHAIVMSSPRGFGEFVMRSARSTEGRRAMKAYRRQRELAFAATAKLEYLEHLLTVHRHDRTLVFTQDNRTAHEVSRRFLVPVITHQTKVTERSEILEAFAKGGYGAVVTSKVLNEGVDVPDANVAVVLSGSGSVREHVQRLGRILRQREGKRALLYELVTARTTETFTSERRREHDAYR